uniref:DUF5641 domain-containing protein n=1 Tax=Heterorhabditis bacteriophora TaxID=37862 RepID=A0A1I7W9J3_HETBA
MAIITVFLNKVFEGHSDPSTFFFLATAVFHTYYPVRGRRGIPPRPYNSQICSNNFWNIWCTKYLSLLREINKWEHKNPRSTTNLSPRIGEIVLLKDDTLPRVHWKLAKICDLPHTSSTRSAKIKLPGGKILNRSISFLSPLEISATYPEVSSPTPSSRYTSESVQQPPPESDHDSSPMTLRRSKRIALRPPKSYIYFVSILCIVFNIDAIAHHNYEQWYIFKNADSKG